MGSVQGGGYGYGSKSPMRQSNNFRTWTYCPKFRHEYEDSSSYMWTVQFIIEFSRIIQYQKAIHLSNH